MNKGGATTCCVLTCFNTHPVLHKFPKPDNKRAWKLLAFKIWLYRACNQVVEDEKSIDEVIRKYRICDHHFSNSCKIPPLNKLRKGSLPTLKLPNFHGEANETNAQIAKLQYCKDSPEIKHFKNVHKSVLREYLLSSKLSKPRITLPKLELSMITKIDKNIENKAKKDFLPVEPPPKPATILKPYFNSVKIYLTDDKRLSEVCRVCFSAIHTQDIVKLSDPPQDPNSKSLKDNLKQALPDLDLEIYENAVICLQCKELVMSCMKLRELSTTTEKKLNKIVEKEKITQKRLHASLILVGRASKWPESSIYPDHDYARRPETPPNIDLFKEIAISSTNVPVEDNNSSDDLDFGKVPVEVFQKKSLWGQGPYLCEECGKVYEEKNVMIRHKHNHKRQQRRLEIKLRQSMCESCGEICYGVTELRKHMRRKHRKEKKLPERIRYQCNICQKVLYNKHSLQTHVRHIHLRIYNYVQCHLCGKTLSTNGALRSHLKIHTDDKKYKCEVCGMRFFWLPRLKKHLRKHSDTKCSCPYCGKSVKYETSLQRHIKIFHMKQGTTNCEFCDKPYWKKFDLDRHKIKVHGWRPEISLNSL